MGIASCSFSFPSFWMTGGEKGEGKKGGEKGGRTEGPCHRDFSNIQGKRGERDRDVVSPIAGRSGVRCIRKRGRGRKKGREGKAKDGVDLYSAKEEKEREGGEGRKEEGGAAIY